MAASYEASSSVSAEASCDPAVLCSEVLLEVEAPACPYVSASDDYDVVADDSWMVGDGFGTHQLTHLIYTLA